MNLLLRVVKTAKVTGAKIQKLPYPLEGESLSKLDNANTPEEIKESARTPFRVLIGMLSYIMGHTKPDIEIGRASCRERV